MIVVIALVSAAWAAIWLVVGVAVTGSLANGEGFYDPR